MEIAVVLLLAVLALGVWSLAGAVSKIAEHNAKFLPPTADVPEFGLSPDDVIVVAAFGSEQVCSVSTVARHEDGYLVVGAQPVGAKRL